MSKYYRYTFVKKYYPNYVVFIRSVDKLITYDYDLKITELYENELDNLHINHLVLDNVNITEKKEYLDNNYLYYFKICLLLQVVEKIKQRKNKMIEINKN